MDPRGRSRRASAQSITMSSGSNSRASSIGPSSFTENLTLYMNGQREPVFPIENGPTGNAPAADTAPPVPAGDTAKMQLESIAGDQNDMQTLRDELRATLQRHNELLAENERLRRDLEDSTAKALQVGPLQRQLEEAKSSLNEANASLEEVAPKLEVAHRQLDVSRLRTEELEQEVAKQTAQSRKSQEGESVRAEKLDALQRELELQEENRRDELDDQSLIDELEDDLERTRHELDKAIKDRQRVERQLEFTKADYEAEKQRVQELQQQLADARKVGKQFVSRESHFGLESGMPASSSPGRNAPAQKAMSNEDIEALRTAMERAELRIDGLESQLELARNDIRMQSEEFAVKTTQAEQRAQAQLREQAEARAEMQAEIESKLKARAMDEDRSDEAAAMDRLGVYIRKLKSQDSNLKQELKEATDERDRLRDKLRDTQNVWKESLKDVDVLRTQIDELEEVKERMSRVLMYQWGKEEVGEIERKRGNGRNERGMGFKYKHFNKDGSLKET